MPIEIPAKPIIIDLKEKNAAEKAATIAVEQAELASKEGTFGVGGLLIDNASGKVLAIARNHVIQEGKLVDPTGHVERQLVDWYYQQQQKGAKLPSPENLTIVSSLDPCVMCGGSIIGTKFNVASVAKDDFAGVTFKGLGDFTAMPEGLRDIAKSKMAYLAVTGDKERPFSGPKDSIFVGQEIPKKLLERSNSAFLASLERVKEAINVFGGVAPEKLKDVGDLKADDALITMLKDINPKIQGLKVDSAKPANMELGKALLEAAAVAKKRGASFNAVALVAPNGQVLHIATGKENESPIRGAFMELTREYAGIRAKAGSKGLEYLPHPKHCKIVMLCGPDQTSADFMQLGAVGSTMEGKVPDANKNWLQYIVPMQPQKQLDLMAAALPPLYSGVIGIKPVQCEDKAVVKYCSSMLEAAKAAPAPKNDLPEKDKSPTGMLPAVPMPLMRMGGR